MSHPKGKLIAIGGAEDKGTDLETGEIHRNNLNFFELGILRRVVLEAGGPSARIEVITTASMIPYEVGESYLNAFGRIGCTNIGLMHIRTRQDAMKEEYIDRIRQCNAVMFTGGNQLRLSATDGGTELLSVIKKRYREENFVIAGTSAGAIQRLSGEITKAMSHPEVKERVLKTGAVPASDTPAAFEAFMTRERQRLADVIAKSGIVLAD